LIVTRALAYVPGRAAIERASGRAVGFIALNLAGEGTAGLDPGEYEIGWWLDPAAQGRGLAREGAQAVLDDALGRALWAQCVSVGAAIAAGTTKLGALLDLSHVEEQALARYTQDEGNHVELEVHDAASLSTP
jgi:hypothetical protein